MLILIDLRRKSLLYLALLKEAIVVFSRIIGKFKIASYNFYRQDSMKIKINTYLHTYFNFLDERRKCPIFLKISPFLTENGKKRFNFLNTSFL